ncbi:MAG: ribonuclease E inhibitor RraB [Saprospiraceae bacterium]|uniref:Ribonuclease E inhibitor RraB n=1 Tax=Candidatus Opimibacter skivensis TaxID=2982028 RepID=A0A9D7T006_9BACT|nr:ribonuclease E inhibitor RraB [Candidatus Opimibacter skivensis]
MGLSIYYRGNLRDPDAAEALITDAMDICHEIGWRYFPIHRSEIMPVEGLFITPEGSESIDLTFLSNGRLYNAAHLLFTRHPEQEIVEEEKHKWIFTKTGYAGSDTHMAIIKFLRYLSQKYFSDFELKDDSLYWESNDVDDCRHRFGESIEAIDMINKARGLMGHDLVEEYPEEDDDDDNESASDDMEELLMRKGGYNFTPNIDLLSKIKNRERTEIQKTMSSAVLRQLYKLGLDEKDSQQIEFFFYADHQDNANNLAIALSRLGYTVEKSEPSSTKIKICFWSQARRLK